MYVCNNNEKEAMNLQEVERNMGGAGGRGREGVVGKKWCEIIYYNLNFFIKIKRQVFQFHSNFLLARKRDVSTFLSAVA